MPIKETRTSRFLLLYPKAPATTYWSFSHALHLLGKRALQPPLGLLTIAGMFPPGTELRLKDLNIEACTDDDLRWADAVFISAMIVQKDSMRECVSRANDLGIPVIAGGPYPTTGYAEVSGVNHFILGEAEISLPLFLRDWQQGFAKKAYARSADPAEVEKLQGHFGIDADIEWVKDRVALDESPRPRFDLLDMNAYKTMSLQTSRGCPHGCEFCDIWRRFGRKMRSKSLPRVLAELDELYRLGWRSSVFIVDDNFVGNPQYSKKLLRELTEWQRARGYPFEFSTEASLSLADDPELLRLMPEAGFEMVFLGLETPADECLREAHKVINTVGSMSERVAKIQAAGMLVTAGFILGFDNEPEDIGCRMSSCIEELGIPVAMVGLLQALPETDLHDRLSREGRLLQASDGNNTHDFSLDFAPSRPAENIVRDYKGLLKGLYQRNLASYFRRCSRLRGRWQPPSHPKQPLKRQEIKWFFRYLFLSLFTSFSWNSLRFLIASAIRKPAFFPLAVSLSVQGYHFREITHAAFRVEALKQTYAEIADQFFVRLRQEREELSRDIARYLHESRGALARRTEAAFAFVEQTRDAVLKNASRRARRVSHVNSESVMAVYQSLYVQLDRAVKDFERTFDCYRCKS